MGRVLWAAVAASLVRRWPLAVRVPELVPTEYQDALPRWTDWTGGFLAGMMWQFYLRELSRGLAAQQESPWRKRAEHYSKLL